LPLRGGKPNAEVASINIKRDAFDISFVITSGTNGAAYIDNLQASIIPEPATLLLLTFGGAFIYVQHGRVALKQGYSIFNREFT